MKVPTHSITESLLSTKASEDFQKEIEKDLQIEKSEAKDIREIVNESSQGVHRGTGDKDNRQHIEPTGTQI
jgi:hypothetical protein